VTAAEPGPVAGEDEASPLSAALVLVVMVMSSLRARRRRGVLRSSRASPCARARPRRLRIAADLTQDDVADAIADAGGIARDRSRLARLERGQRQVRLGEAVLLARVLGSTVDDMIGER
jgi:hypothetical protein